MQPAHCVKKIAKNVSGYFTSNCCGNSPLGGQCSRLVRRLYEAAATVPAAELSMSRRAQSTGGRQIVFTRVYIKDHTETEPEP